MREKRLKSASKPGSTATSSSSNALSSVGDLPENFLDGISPQEKNFGDAISFPSAATCTINNIIGGSAGGDTLASLEGSQQTHDSVHNSGGSGGDPRIGTSIDAFLANQKLGATAINVMGDGMAANLTQLFPVFPAGSIIGPGGLNTSGGYFALKLEPFNSGDGSSAIGGLLSPLQLNIPSATVVNNGNDFIQLQPMSDSSNVGGQMYAIQPQNGIPFLKLELPPGTMLPSLVAASVPVVSATTNCAAPSNEITYLQQGSSLVNQANHGAAEAVAQKLPESTGGDKRSMLTKPFKKSHHALNAMNHEATLASSSNSNRDAKAYYASSAAENGGLGGSHGDSKAASDATNNFISSFLNTSDASSSMMSYRQTGGNANESGGDLNLSGVEFVEGLMMSTLMTPPAMSSPASANADGTAGTGGLKRKDPSSKLATARKRPVKPQVSGAAAAANYRSIAAVNIDDPIDALTEEITGEMEMESANVETKDLCSRIAYELKAHSIPQAVFAERILGRSQGTLSDLLRNPKPWAKLKSGRETFRRMWCWLKQPLPQRLAILELWKNAGEGDEARVQEQVDQILEKPPKPTQRQIKKPRLVFTDIQKRTLQAIFKETQRPSKEMQITIAEHLGLDLTTVQNFFMNARRRCRDRFEEKSKQQQHLISPRSDVNDPSTASSSKAAVLNSPGPSGVQMSPNTSKLHRDPIISEVVYVDAVDVKHPGHIMAPTPPMRTSVSTDVQASQRYQAAKIRVPLQAAKSSALSGSKPQGMRLQQFAVVPGKGQQPPIVKTEDDSISSVIDAVASGQVFTTAAGRVRPGGAGFGGRSGPAGSVPQQARFAPSASQTQSRRVSASKPGAGQAALPSLHQSFAATSRSTNQHPFSVGNHHHVISHVTSGGQQLYDYNPDDYLDSAAAVSSVVDELYCTRTGHLLHSTSSMATTSAAGQSSSLLYSSAGSKISHFTKRQEEGKEVLIPTCGQDSIGECVSGIPITSISQEQQHYSHHLQLHCAADAIFTSSDVDSFLNHCDDWGSHIQHHQSHDFGLQQEHQSIQQNDASHHLVDGSQGGAQMGSTLTN